MKRCQHVSRAQHLAHCNPALTKAEGCIMTYPVPLLQSLQALSQQRHRLLIGSPCVLVARLPKAEHPGRPVGMHPHVHVPAEICPIGLGAISRSNSWTRFCYQWVLPLRQCKIFRRDQNTKYPFFPSPFLHQYPLFPQSPANQHTFPVQCRIFTGEGPIVGASGEQQGVPTPPHFSAVSPHLKLSANMYTSHCPSFLWPRIKCEN